MFTTSVKRIAKSGFFNFWRNGYVSLASVLVMVVTLFVIGSVLLTGVILDYTLQSIKSKVDINVFFVPSANEEDVLSLKRAVENLPEVASVEYQSRELVLAEFKERHDETTISALEELEENPLGAQLNITAKDPSQYAGVANYLENQNLSASGEVIIDHVNYNQNREAIEKLSQIITSVDRLGFILAITLIVVSVLITFNTIRLAIFISRDEIGVMRLVGASRSYIRGPFVVTGVMYGLVAGIITLALFYPITFWLGDATKDFFIGLNIFNYYLDNFGEIMLVVLGSGVVIGALSSFLAVRKYLKF